MSLEHVDFKKMTKSKFNTITPDDSTFYRVTDNGEEELYVGDRKLDVQNPYSVDNDGYLTVDYTKLAL